MAENYVSLIFMDFTRISNTLCYFHEVSLRTARVIVDNYWLWGEHLIERLINDLLLPKRVYLNFAFGEF